MLFDFPQLKFPVTSFRIKEENEKMFIFDVSRRKYVILTLEEWVRQNCLHFLRDYKNFPINMLAVERSFKLNNLVYRFDIVGFSRTGKPILLVECKAPDVKITQKTFDQISVYNLELKIPYMLVTNGTNIFCCVTDFKNSKYIFLEDIPDFKQINLALRH